MRAADALIGRIDELVVEASFNELVALLREVREYLAAPNALKRLDALILSPSIADLGPFLDLEVPQSLPDHTRRSRKRLMLVRSARIRAAAEILRNCLDRRDASFARTLGQWLLGFADEVSK